jgi:hypothetical protein
VTDYLLVSPRAVFKQISDALPAKVREYVIVVGSLAAGFHFFGGRHAMGVRTKDADCLLSPRLTALAAGKALARELVGAGWTYHPVEGFPAPGKKTTPTGELPVLRLDPPGQPGWFLEVLGAHRRRDARNRSFARMETPAGHFALASFQFLALAERDPLDTDLGVRIARPEAMALANLLAHPRIGTELMSQPMQGRDIKRSNKDLGRVLAIADLAGDPAVQGWAKIWWSDLRACFSAKARALARRAGTGLRELLDSPEDLDEATHTCQWGLLAERRRSAGALRAVGRRLIQDAVEPLAALATRGRKGR